MLLGWLSIRQHAKSARLQVRGAWHCSFYPHNLLLHYDDDLPGVEGVVEDGGDDVKASPGRLDFLTVGE